NGKIVDSYEAQPLYFISPACGREYECGSKEEKSASTGVRVGDTGLFGGRPERTIECANGMGGRFRSIGSPVLRAGCRSGERRWDRRRHLVGFVDGYGTFEDAQ